MGCSDMGGFCLLLVCGLVYALHFCNLGILCWLELTF